MSERYHDVEKRRYALRLAYLGSAFRGFQRQPPLPTVQEALERSLRALGITSRLEAAARTDAGVHALGQVVSFTVRADLDPEALRAGVNRETPPEILCLEARRVPDSFHARASAASRRYLYLVGVPPPPGLAPYAWTLPDERAFPRARPDRLDAAAMRAALGAAVGEHDFRAFARPGGRRGTVRTIERAEVVEASWAHLYAVMLDGGGFLRAMVRNLVGTAVAIGLGLAPPRTLAEMLAAGGRYRGARAPGWGLTLVSVAYPTEALGQ